MRKLLKRILCLIAFILIIPNEIFYSLSNINITMYCDNTDPISGEEFTISFIVTSEEEINISAYKLSVNFDSSRLAYKGLYSDIDNDDFKTYVSGNTLNILYMTSENGFTINRDCNKTILELNFKVLSTANVGVTSISANIDGICNYEAEEIPISEIDSINITISPPGIGNCDLATLETSGYTLTPAFSPDVTAYSIDVPYSKSTIEFNALASDDDASVKVSRKTLKSAGSSTDINLTVTSADKKSRKIYTVTVNRLSKEETIIKNLKNSNSSKSKNDSSSDEDSLTYPSTVDGSNSDILSSPHDLSPLVVKENGFNIILFAVVSLAFIGISILIIKRKNN